MGSFFRPSPPPPAGSAASSSSPAPASSPSSSSSPPPVIITSLFTSNTMASTEQAPPSPFQPEPFTTPEGLYLPSPTHFLPTYVPVPIAGNPLPPIPVRMALTEVRYPARKEGTGLGGLLGLGGSSSVREESGDGESTTSDDPTGSSGAPSEQMSSSVSDMHLLAPPSPNGAVGALSSSFASTSLSSSSALGSTPGRSGGFLSRPANGAGANPRPKTSLRSTSSSFVTRIQSPESSLALLANRSKTGETVTWGFWHHGRTLGWVELGGKAKEPLARITFSQQLSAVAVQEMGKTHERMDLFLGFGTGDIVWLDPISFRYTRLNKAGLIHPLPVTQILPHPTNPLLFFAIYTDGTIMTFSVALDDPPSSFAAPWLAEAPAGSKGLYRWRNEVREGEKDKERLKFAGRNPIAVWKLPAPAASQGKEGTRTFPPAMVIMSPPPAGYTTNSGPSPYTVPQNGFQSANPASANAYGAAAAAAAELVRKRAVASAEISRDGRWMGLVGDDGNLKLIDLESERLSDQHASYFGGLTALAFSPDSRFLLFAGQDDLITVLSLRDQRVVARCEGHCSFVSGLAWDRERCDVLKERYRFASVGEDGKLLLWDFAPAGLHRPKGGHHGHHSTRSFSHQLRRHSGATSLHDAPGTDGSPEEDGPTLHPPPLSHDVALVQPVVAKTADPGILTQVHYINDAVCTVSRNIAIRFWSRPPPAKGMATGGAAGRRGLGIQGGGREIGVTG